MFYSVYQVTNTINGKIYIGTHITSKVEDDYMGSGTLLKRAIKKYGISNFIKEILFVFDTPEAMFAKEAELVNEEYLKRDDVYNVMVGGYGGFDYVNANGLNVVHTAARSAKLSLAHKGRIGKLHTNETKLKMSLQRIGNPSTFIGKSHSEATKLQMSAAHKGKHDGEKNSQFGTCWMTNGTINKKVPKTQVDLMIAEGYYKGRILS